MSNNSIQKADFVFIGMGAANCLLVLKMHEHGLLSKKKLAIIEHNSKAICERNFCFWSTEEELLKLKLENLVSSKWQQIKVGARNYQTITPLSYHHIRGIDLHDKVTQLLKEQDVSYYNELFDSKPLVKPKSFVIHLTDTTIEASKVFDSRPPTYNVVENNQSHLLQSFYGWEISAPDYNFDTSTMVMMDFDIPQNNYCQFMYILPFTKNSALFEVTRFGKEKITKDEAKTILIDYLAQFGFSYQIIEEEKGVIPMSSCEITKTNYGENWVVTGANANMVKPTTGYAFHNMAIDATNHVAAMVNQQPFVREKDFTRFKYYDSLLLKILEETPQHGKKIFQNLFHHISINNVLSFLNEKSSFTKELYIFSKLPILIFLRVACKDLFSRCVKLSPAYLAFSITLVSLFFYALHLDSFLWILLGIGFLSVGLSHGALDYLTEKVIHTRGQFVKYIATYLIKGTLLGLLWIFMPDLALVVFLAFSAWHFGEADFREWNHKQGFSSFIWGGIVLFTILFYHQEETIAVLQHIKGLHVQHLIESLSVNQLFIGKLVLLFFSLLFAAYNRSKLMLLTLCYLLLSTMLSLILSFGIYFVMQHSLHGWRHLKNDLKTNSYNLFLKALPFSLGGVFIFLTFMFLNNKDYMGIFFIILSCISMPHIFSMHNFYANSSKK